MTDLPVSGERRERADAARNRERVLTAAQRLFAEHGVRAVTMSDVAREAGVAKGTVFQRFGDRAGLALALVDEQERELQERILRGPPPLGPAHPRVSGSRRSSPPSRRSRSRTASCCSRSTTPRRRRATAPAPTGRGSSTSCCCSASWSPRATARSTPTCSSRRSPRTSWATSTTTRA